MLGRGVRVVLGWKDRDKNLVQSPESKVKLENIGKVWGLWDGVGVGFQQSSSG